MRTFIALDIDEAVRSDLIALQNRLRRHLPHLKYTRPEHLHLTLKFLGEIEESQCDAISASLSTLVADQKPFEMSLSSIGCFGPRGTVSVIWAGLQERSGELKRLHQRIESAMELLGFPPDHRPFSPHLTIARNKNPRSSKEIRKLIERDPNFEAGPQPVTSLTFYHSTPGQEGLHYRVISTHRFGAFRATPAPRQGIPPGVPGLE